MNLAAAKVLLTHVLVAVGALIGPAYNKTHSGSLADSTPEDCSSMACQVQPFPAEWPLPQGGRVYRRQRPEPNLHLPG